MSKRPMRIAAGMRPVRPMNLPDVGEMLTAVLSSQGLSPGWQAMFRHDGSPQSKQRARVVVRNGKSMAFTPRETRTAQESLAWQWKLSLKGETHNGPLAIACLFFRPNHQRIDTDNLVKLVLDAGTQARAWKDDSQVTTIVARIEYDPDHPRTEIAYCPDESTLDRRQILTFKCKHCKAQFERPNRTYLTSIASTDYCSSKCAQRARLGTARCRICSVVFERKRTAQSYCSHACRDIGLGRLFPEAVAAGKRKPQSLCTNCGKRVSRREYTKCSDCSPKGRPKGSKNKAPLRRCRLTPEQLAGLRSARSNGITLAVLAREYELSPSSVASWTKKPHCQPCECCDCVAERSGI